MLVEMFQNIFSNSYLLGDLLTGPLYGICIKTKDAHVHTHTHTHMHTHLSKGWTGSLYESSQSWLMNVVGICILTCWPHPLK